VSAPEELPDVRIALREGSQSSYKKALALVEPGEKLAVTGVWGDFVLPSRASAPVLMVAAGIGVTPFVSQLRHLRLSGSGVTWCSSTSPRMPRSSPSERARRRRIPVIVFTRTEPATLPAHWTWAQGVRLDAAGLLQVVPDLATRHAYVSGPPRLIADLAPALEKARTLTTDAFSGY
jgi:ferredoxin-NADP reductase